MRLHLNVLHKCSIYFEINNYILSLKIKCLHFEIILVFSVEKELSILLSVLQYVQIIIEYLDF